MLIFENIALAFSGLWANKMRALLTMLGIIIGIGSVIAIVTVGNSMSQGLNEEMQNMGASNVTVYVTQRRTEEENMQMGGMTMATSFSFAQFSEQDNLTDDMIAKYRQQLADKIKYISINTRVDGDTAKSGKLTSDVSIMGVNDDYLKVTGVELLTGRAINEKDEANHRKVCIVSNQLTNKLFPNQDPIGKKVDLKINNDLQTYYIVGVYKQSDSEMRYSMTGTASTNVYLPISTAKAASNSAPGYQEITVMPEVGVDNETFIAETNAFFEKMYKKNKN
ncbi:MAG: ABC transporter permease, partial [Oscillospiraceae bacterium]